MEKEIQNLLTDNILQQAVKIWKGDSAFLKLLGDVENFVYEFNDKQKNFILRITHSSHRNKELIAAELDWINFLAANKINACKPVLSVNNSFVETIPAENSYFIICAFEKARGERPFIKPGSNQVPEWSNQFIKNFGSLLGKMHSVTRNYSENHLYKRQQWFEEDLILNYEKYLPANQKKIIQELKNLIIFFKDVPKNSENYGLIHADLHGGNIFIDNQEIIIFDFDDSCYHWYIYDIAITIYSILLRMQEPEERELFARKFTKYFLEGYRLENTLDENWLKLFPEIFRLRELTLYVFLNKKWDLRNLNERDQEYYNNLKNRIDNCISLVNFEDNFFLE